MARQIVANIQAHPYDRHLAMVTRRRFGYELRDALLEVEPSRQVDLGFEEGILESWPAREAFLFFCLLADADAPTWRAWLGYQRPDRQGAFKGSPGVGVGSHRRLHRRRAESWVGREIEGVGEAPAAVSG